ncbi:mutt/nudix family protein-like protein [Leptomonas pyrrhocoris]|uniref:NAD(+) diphosphatase n=1 Tax=Leptomonas pyrrhocoris TaxID=157538 RepID=A0A0N0DSB6_LEPPY|nr:mutt/nudix family protein-like protein [Leptomonas pyrrhocoris]XP_015654302.1 mutt/nudix family protein-like protein [Leptomonas pyrrhocoris]XP_015654303.1 mutt/nudix family protein-like protein [Leptomonas pyrrhocoris]KPA75862.1 mutt/nudix family protein-like protein [Leptomonas pyrrhocoris]KPA75863.1 mutt/nudix family protein-like protein [Leptomonas pyrrhocoris]KPA75864.1 mutt/nudix family protein-like protein [Leptomonas pyrrhocoris]|eukprot:XP_015654301.1 mutt/nudix family protein-like protein [Leptomonas pyrrhocoris]
MEKVLARSSLLSFPLGHTLVRLHEKERHAAAFFARCVAPAAKPCAAVCKEDGSGVLVNGAVANWLHPIPLHGGSSFLTVPLSQTVYVGEDTTQPRNVFVVGSQEVESDYAEHRDWVAPMSVFPALSAAEQSLLSLALSLKQWAALTPFCARCGSSMHSTDYGLTRACTGCKNRIYPPVVPAMIVAVLDGKGSVIMSQRLRPHKDARGKPMRTVLSGFVAQGESMEETVVREVLEETGARVTSLRYVGSQPWPTPYELMTCYYAVAEDSPNITADADELTSVHWVPKAEVRQALAGQHPDYAVVPDFTAAHVLLSKWANGEVDDRGQPTRKE